MTFSASIAGPSISDDEMYINRIKRAPKVMTTTINEELG